MRERPTWPLNLLRGAALTITLLGTVLAGVWLVRPDIALKLDKNLLVVYKRDEKAVLARLSRCMTPEMTAKCRARYLDAMHAGRAVRSEDRAAGWRAQLFRLGLKQRLFVGAYADALELGEAFVAFDDKDATAWYLYARALDGAGGADGEVEAALDRAWSINPQSREIIRYALSRARHLADDALTAKWVARARPGGFVVFRVVWDESGRFVDDRDGRWVSVLLRDGKTFEFELPVEVQTDALLLKLPRYPGLQLEIDRLTLLFMHEVHEIDLAADTTPRQHLEVEGRRLSVVGADPELLLKLPESRRAPEVRALYVTGKVRIPGPEPAEGMAKTEEFRVFWPDGEGRFSAEQSERVLAVTEPAYPNGSIVATGASGDGPVRLDLPDFSNGRYYRITHPGQDYPAVDPLPDGTLALHDLTRIQPNVFKVVGDDPYIVYPEIPGSARQGPLSISVERW